MHDLERMVQTTTVKYHQKIKQACLPLKDSLNIDVFTYFQIDSVGQFITLSNHPPLLEFHYAQNLHLTNPYLVHTDLLRSGYVLTQTTANQKYLSGLRLSSDHFKIANPLLMLKKTERTVEGFFFSSPSTIDYLQYLDLLKKFASFFTHETASLLGKMDKVDLAKEKGTAFFSRSAELPLANNNPALHRLMQAVSPLSPRERECLDLFQQGHSAQATAAHLGISQRTVEHHFENIKLKLDVRSKRDLLER